MKKPKIHFFVDNTFWSGAEQLLTCLLGSEQMREAFDMTISYRYSDVFFTSMYEWWTRAGVQPFPVQYPLHYPRLSINAFAIKDKIKVALEAFKPDILHISNGGFPAAMGCNIAVMAGAEAKIPKIIYSVNNMPTRLKGLKLLFWPFVRFACEHVDLFLSGSEAVARAMRDRYGVRARSLATTVHRNELAFSGSRLRFQRGVDQDGVVICSVGTLEKRKGHVYLVKAFKELMKEHGRKLHLWIIGQGPEKERLEEMSDNMVYFGTDVANAYSYINACDVYCQPSLEHEDFPVSVLQAMSLGKPVVCTDVAGMPEQVRNCVDGYVVKPGGWAYLYDALAVLTKDDSEPSRKWMGENAKQRFDQEFSYDRVVNRYVELYRSLL